MHESTKTVSSTASLIVISRFTVAEGCYRSIRMEARPLLFFVTWKVFFLDMVLPVHSTVEKLTNIIFMRKNTISLTWQAAPTTLRVMGNRSRASSWNNQMPIVKREDPNLAILSYRSTPLQNGFSHSELLINRKLRTTVPMTIESRESRKYQIKHWSGNGWRK